MRGLILNVTVYLEQNIKMRIRIPLLFVILVSAGCVYSQTGGVRASQRASVYQEVASTRIRIEYSRPVAKGRRLFGPGGIVRFGGIWMPGANEASNISFSSDVLINGESVKAGRYSFWTIPGEKAWTLILSKDWDQWHTAYPGRKEDALRIRVAPETGSHMETLAFYFPVVSRTGATLNLHWGTTIIALDIKVAGIR